MCVGPMVTGLARNSETARTELPEVQVSDSGLRCLWVLASSLSREREVGCCQAVECQHHDLAMRAAACLMAAMVFVEWGGSFAFVVPPAAHTVSRWVADRERLMSHRSATTCGGSAARPAGGVHALRMQSNPAGQNQIVRFQAADMEILRQVGEMGYATITDWECTYLFSIHTCGKRRAPPH